MEKLSSINQSTLLGKVGDFKQPSPNFRFKYCAPIGTKPKAWVKELFGANIEHDESRKMPYTLGEWEQKSILSSDVHDPEKIEIKIECNGNYFYEYIGRDFKKSPNVYSAGTNVCEGFFDTRFQTLEEAINHTIKCRCEK